jgi:Mn-containing catalase
MLENKVMSFDTPTDLLFDQLRDLHSMESQLPESLLKIGQTTRYGPLRDVVMEQSDETLRRKVRLAAIFKKHDVSPGHDVCKAMAGLVEGGEDHLALVDDDATRDLMVLAHCLRVHHYGIAGYDIAGRLAERLGLVEDAELLTVLMTEEENAIGHLLALEPELFKIACPSKSRATSRE